MSNDLGIETSQELPEGWRTVKLGKVAEFINGRAYSANELLTQGKYPVLRVGNLFTSDQWYFSNLELDSKNYCDKGDLLYAWSASFGPFIWSGSKAIFHYHIWKVLCNEELDSAFAYFALQYITQQVKQKSHGLAILHMTKEGIEKFEIPLPPLREQQRIAHLLNEKLVAVDEARAAAESRLEAIKALPASSLREVFPPENDLPKNWRRVQLGKIARTTSGSTPNRSDPRYYNGIIPWVKTGELKDGFIDQTEERLTEVALQECSLPLLPPQTLLIAMYGQGQTRGRTGLLKIQATTNQACFAILPNEEEFYPPFLQVWFRHNYESIRKDSENRGGNQPNLNGQILKAMKIMLPPLSEQKEIVARLDEQMANTKAARKATITELDAINTMPAALLRQAFNGEL